jgi:ABC-type transporter Mla MlaB component
MATKTTTKRKRATAPAEPVAATPATASAPAAEPARSESVVALASNSTVKDAAALKSTLAQVLEAPGSVTIDAKSVERIDTAIIQVLCAFVRDRAERNLAIEWRGTPQPLFDAARLLGVGALLALPSQAEA